MNIELTVEKLLDRAVFLAVRIGITMFFVLIMDGLLTHVPNATSKITMLTMKLLRDGAAEMPESVIKEISDGFMNMVKSEYKTRKNKVRSFVLNFVEKAWI